MHTKDMLADELIKVGLMDMSLKARGGYYHDFPSPLALPKLQLMADLFTAAQSVISDKPRHDAIMAIRTRVMDGDFDASKEESDAWAASSDGHETFRRLIKGE